MRIQKLFSLCVLLVSLTTWADIVNQPLFDDLAKCRQHFLATKGGGGKNFDVNKADEFCKKVMTPMDFCVGRSLMKAMAENSLSATQIEAFKAKFRGECVAASSSHGAAQSASQLQQGLQQQVIADQLAAAQAAAAAKKAAEEAKKNEGKKEGGDKGAGGPDLGSIAKAAQGLLGGKDGKSPLDSIFGGKDKDSSKPTEKPTEAKDGAPAASTTDGAQAAAPAEAPALSPKEQEYADAADREDAELGKAMKDQAGNDGEVLGDKATPEEHFSKADELKAQQPAQQAELDKAADEFKQHSPEAGQAAEGLKDQAGGDKAEPKPSENITEAAKKTSAELNQKVQQASSSAQGELSQGTYSLPFSKTAAEVQKAQTEIKAYTEATKEKCSTSAEKADTLCKEETSPGRIATNGFMSIMGPILGSITSAQKALGTTAKTADTAKKGLAVAKTSCQVAQATCGGLCQAAIADLEKKKSTAEQQIQTSLQSDEQASEAICKTYDQSAQACMSCECCDPSQYIQAAQSCRQENQQKKQAGEKAKKEITAAVQKEQTPENGTSPGLAKTCQSLQKEVDQLASQIGELLKKMKEAAEGEKKLNNSGVAGTDAVTPQQYCETKIGKDTEFCKCQKDNTKEGCSGHITAATQIGKQQDQAGINLKTGSGLSNFAGIMQKKEGDVTSGAPASAASGGADGNNQGLALPVGAQGSSTAAASGSGSGGVSGFAGGKSSGKADTASNKEQKWSFGSFMNALTGGSSSGGSKGGKPAANGNYSGGGSIKDPKQAAAIQRKLASDKVASEVTTASGKSNWEKIRQAYIIKENTLLSGQ